LQKQERKTQLKGKKTDREKFIEELISQTENDFEQRRKERLQQERQWELNINFLTGNQYCDVNSNGEIYGEDKTFFWQNRRVFNHIAPVIETRLAKFSRITPTVFVRPKSDDDSDIEKANLAEKFIDGVFKRSNLEEIVRKVNTWSEACGTAFYKIVWDNQAGNQVGELDGEMIYEGDVKILSVSPFEIFPDSLYTENIQDCLSIIHARAMPVEIIKQKYGVSVVGEDIGVFNLNKVGKVNFNKDSANSTLKNSAIVIEKYEKPTSEYPNGRLITVSNGKLLYYGELPYRNGIDGKREYPFIKQEALTSAGSFFGTSIIERLIPVQRAFNAVKNRKHEFLNRLSMGIMTVEDGSLDTDDLAEEGLSPGKVLVYRQGSKAPEMMEEISMPSDFNEEEEKLINEFVIISGVPDISSTTTNTNIRSGSALEILVEQDNERLIFSAENIRRSYLEVAKHTVRLYAQFISGVRAVRYQDGNKKTKIVYADKQVLGQDDVYLDSENELLYSHSQKKEMIFRLYESGLLSDEEGNIRPVTREKILTLLGYKDLDYKKGLARLHEEKAQKENEIIKTKGKDIEEIDDDRIHIDEHTRYILCEYDGLTEEQKARLLAHVAQHNQRINKKGE
jgi:hypothetical protein